MTAKPIAAVAASSLFAACFLPGFEKVDGTAVGGGGGAGAGEDPCSARWPAQVLETSADTDSIVINLATRTIDIGERDVTVAPGFDLDRSCTCCEGCTEAQTCTPPGEPLCDAPRGRDNAVAHFLSRLQETVPSPVTTDALQAEIDAGAWTILMRITGYNGQPDDDQVVVSLYGTSALGSAPTWTGQDVWSMRSDYLPVASTNPDEALVRSDIAYVAGGFLVGTFGAAAPLRLSLTGGFDLKLSSAVVSGRLEPSGESFRLLDATLGGMWSMPDVFVSLANLRSGGVAVACRMQSLYEDTLKPLLCSLRDSRPGFDTPTPCDGLSFGAAFVSEPVIIEGVSSPPLPGTPCAPGTEPTGDACP